MIGLQALGGGDTHHPRRIGRAREITGDRRAYGFCRYLPWPDSFEFPRPVVDGLPAGTSVRKNIEFGVMRIITGLPLLSLPVISKELGTTLTSLNPADVSLC